MANNEIRVQLLVTGLKHWQVAAKMGISETSFSRKLRYELPEQEKTKLLGIIDELAKQKAV